VRYNDGEWNAIFQRHGENCDGHEYYPDMGRALIESLQPDPTNGYHVGICPGLLKPREWWASRRVIEFLAARPDLALCNSLMLQSASQRGDLGRLFDALRGKRIVFVGNAGMRGIAERIELADFVEVPERNCWTAGAEIAGRITFAAIEPGIVMLACGMPAKVWARQAWRDGGAASLLDVGSVLDPYCGRLTRNYMRRGEYVLAAR